jgi:hypothetical protein
MTTTFRSEKLEGKRLTRRPRHRRDDDMKMNLVHYHVKL